MLVSVRSIVMAGCLLGVVVASAAGGTIRHDRADARYVGYGAQFSSVGRVSAGLAGGGGLTGSGVLIAPDLVITAAHVTDGTSSLRFAVPELGISYGASAVVTHPSWRGDVLSGFDLSIFRLERPVTEVAPAPLFPGWWDAARPGAIAGYGITGTGLRGYEGRVSDSRRAGTNVIDRRLSGRILLSDFDAPHYSATGAFLGSPVPLDLEYTIAPGDSGGGLFVWANRRWQLVGINSFILSYDGDPDASYGDSSGFTRLRVFQPWIQGVMAGTIGMTPLGVAAGFSDAGVGVAAVGVGAVPEPGGVAALAAGVVSLLFRRRGG